jgi:uncharacterized membrane protein YccC
LIDLQHWTGSWAGTWRDSWPRLRQAVQTAVAACLAYAVAALLEMPQGFWAVVTAIMIMQANVGASLGLAVDRLVGSLLGVLVGGGVALLLADTHALKYAGLAATILVLAFFSAHRPSLRIACVTAAIVILGDPRLGPPISSAGYRMIEVLIGTAAAIFTTLALLPSRAGPAFAEHVVRTMPLLFELLSGALSAALGGRYDSEGAHVTAEKVRAAFAAGDALARQAKLEVAGYLADHADPDAVVRTLRRLWHTEIMVLRAAASPLPAAAVAVLRPSVESLRAAVEALAANYAYLSRGDATADLAPVEAAIAAVEQEISGMRQRGELRELPLDDVIRLMAFDFALAQMRINLKDLGDRSRDLAGFTGTTMPWLRRLREAVKA